MPGIENDVLLLQLLLQIAHDLKINHVITNDSHYIEEKDYNLQRIMMAIDQNTTIDDDNLFISDSSSGYFKTRDELRKTFLESYADNNTTVDDFEIACDNTLRIAEKCNSYQPDMNSKLPQIEDANNKLTTLVAQALKEKQFGTEYIERAKFELSRIIEKNFASYFLICRDIVLQSTQELGMPVGPRGSAGGSLVCYLIGIHSIDPIKFQLDFDRFLSSSRGGTMLQVNMKEDE